MEPEIHDGIQLTENDLLPSCSAGLDQSPANRERKKEEAGSFITVVIIFQMHAVAFPISDGETEYASFIVQNLIIKEPCVFKVFHPFLGLCCRVYSKYAG